MQVLIDRRTLQAEHHLEGEYARGKRLSGLLEEIKAVQGGTQVAFIDDLDQLGNGSLFLIPTKIYQPYESGELASIRQFVDRGGHLLLMSNHAPFDEYDGHVAGLWNIDLESVHGGRAEMDEHCFTDHPIATEIVKAKGVLVTGSSCRITAPADSVVVRLPSDNATSDVIGDRVTNAYCVAIDQISGAGGRVVVVADSGWACSCDMRADGLGAGLLKMGANRLFLRQILCWLLGL